VSWKVECADVLDWAERYDGKKFHALLCDPPYELGFMGKDWDRSGIAFNPDTWAALAEHLYPGAFGMAFASSRGWHRLAVAIEDAGLRIHPSIFMLGWSYGSGFPKATNISGWIDKSAGHPPRGHRIAVASRYHPDGTFEPNGENLPPHEYKEPMARVWQSHRYGLQAMKPALEPIIVFQKPYPKGKKTWESIVETGAGALNIDGGRIATDENWSYPNGPGGCKSSQFHYQGRATKPAESHSQGRWPPNFCLIHSPECERVGEKKIESKSRATAGGRRKGGQAYGDYKGYENPPEIGYADSDGLETISDWRCVPECPVYRLGLQSGERAGPWGKESESTRDTSWFSGRTDSYGKLYRDTGTAARFFHQSDWSYEIAERLAMTDPVRYCAKAGRKERDAGLDEWEAKMPGPETLTAGIERKNAKRRPERRSKNPMRNPHPTVKPISLAKWLATLLLPPVEYAPRRILIPFLGSGSEAIGAGLVGWEFILGIEMGADTVEIAEARLRHWLDKPRQAEMDL